MTKQPEFRREFRPKGIVGEIHEGRTEYGPYSYYEENLRDHTVITVGPIEAEWVEQEE